MAACDILVQGWRISRTAYAAGSSRGELFWSDSLESPRVLSFAHLLPRPPGWHRSRPAPSDRQPDRLHVDNHPSGWPAVWLHNDHTNMAWIIVDIGPADWCKLAYQFGHELGHVLCNSWNAQSKPRPPCQWLEEAMVEAFSIRGLGRLAASWERNPPFARDAAFGAAIRDYRENLIKNYRGAGEQMSDAEIASWFRASRSALESGSAFSGGPLIVRIVGELERDNACVEDLGGLNRWLSRSGVPLEDYLTRWGRSCTEVHARGQLPARLRSLLLVS